ncbi:MAG: hypothetical protein IPK82_36295 [Polyangiaceae bacterium]|nr:hypothetical protein [Polyangiaceae bacterium]
MVEPTAAVESTLAPIERRAAVEIPSFLREKSTPASVSKAPQTIPTSTPAPVPTVVRAEVAHSTATAAVDVAAILKKAVPFDPFAKSAAVATPSQAGPNQSKSNGMSGETVDVDVGAIARKVLAFGASKPTSPATPPPKRVFTLDEYAALSAEIAMVGNDPVGRQAVFQRFAVSNPDALIAEWRARFGEDPQLAGRWSAAYAAHYARLRAERYGIR